MGTRKSVKSDRARKAKAILSDLLQVPSAPAEGQGAPSGDLERVRAQIAARAYGLYEARGFREGGDVQDWLDAEREVLSHSQADEGHHADQTALPPPRRS